MDTDLNKIVTKLIKQNLLKFINTISMFSLAIYIGSKTNIIMGVLSLFLLYLVPVLLMIKKDPTLLYFNPDKDETRIPEIYYSIASNHFIVNCIIFVILSLFVF